MALLVATLLAFAVPLTVASAPAAVAQENGGLAPFDAVDPFIGTELDLTQNKSNDAYGNTFPSGALPFGLVQPSPTTYNTDPDAHSLVREKGGYEYTADQIRGFGLTRYSGTGCHERFGGYDFPTTPYVGELDADGALPRSPGVDHRSYFLDFSHDDEVAEPGYYAVTTDNGVTTELTATTRSAVSRFSFPDALDATLIVNAAGANNRVHDAVIEIDPETNTISGSTYGVDLCDDGTHYRAFFSTTYDQDFASWGVWDGATLTADGTSAERITGDTGADHRQQIGGWITFAPGVEVTARTGFSFVSVENAAANREAEAESSSFDQLRADARAEWEAALGLIEVEGGTPEQHAKLYTALYHALLHPNIQQDVNGEYRGPDDQIHTVADGRDHYDNFAGGGWDMFRGHAQLLAMLYPQVASDINQSIVDQVEQYGGWPAFRGVDSLQNVVSILDAFGATDYDREAALASIVETQTLPSTSSNRFHAFQYFATSMIENAKGGDATSRVLDHAVTDFTIAQLAQRLGDDDAYDTFIARAQSWRTVFDPQTEHIRPRSRSNFDRGFDLRDRGNQFHQSTGFQWGWHVQHNLGALIELRGGPEAAEAALDVLMEDLDAGAYTQTGNYLSNQPALSTPWVYNWLGRPDKTTDVLYRAVDEMYDTSPSGLPGNDDMGSLSSWYIFANLGITPTIYGTAHLVVSAPMFDHITISSADSDRVYELSAPGVSDGERYTIGLEVDGQAQTASWLDEDVARDGGVLSFEMSSTPGDWGTGDDDLPPSFTDGSDERNNVGTVPHGAAWMGSMDLSDWAFSRDQLAGAGAGPGDEIPHGDTGIVFTWPDTEPGEPDNWIPHGQRIELEPHEAATISFLGLATNGPSEGTAIVEYTDGSTQDVGVYFADWAQNPAGGNTTLVTANARVNATNGNVSSGTFRVFGTRPVALDQDKTVAAVVLPSADTGGIMHVFDVATGEDEWVDPNAPAGIPERIVLTSTEDPATSQYVTWRSRSQGPLTGVVEIRPADGGEVVSVDAEQKPERTVDGYPSRSHSALLEGLEPSTSYEYRVASGSQFSDWFEFTTAAAEAEPFTFLYFGDAQNGIPTIYPLSIDDAIADHPDARLGIYAGDLVDHAQSEQEWSDWFDAMSPVRTSTQVLATLGNHEIGGQPFIENFTDSFEYDANGPIPADAREFADTHGEHLAEVLKDTAYFVDYQGVRFISVNANHDDICPISRPPDQPDNCQINRNAWFTAQAHWLERIIQDNPHHWTVVFNHQPIFSVGVSGGGLRDEVMYRQHIVPVLERNDVDLVLQGHDHTYGRGHHNSSNTTIDGVAAGPVYVLANAGEKMYDLPPAHDNRWTQNNANLVVSEQDAATYQSIRVDEQTLTFESVVTWVAPRGAGQHQIGDVLDAFTVTKYDDGTKWVTEDGVEAPGPDEPAQNLPLPNPEPFDPDDYDDVVWDDDFTQDLLDEYEIYGAQSEQPASDIQVDTDAGSLTVASSSRSWTQLALPLEAGEQFALVVEPERFAGGDLAEDSLFLGITDGPERRAHSWYNHTQAQSGIDVQIDAPGQGLATGAGPPYPVAWEPGDRMAVRGDHGEITVWIEKDGGWELVRRGLLSLAMDPADYTSWTPTVSVRQDEGQIELSRITLLRPDAVDDPDDPPSIAIGVDPAEPDGPDGAYVSPVTVTVSSDDDEALLEWREGGGDWIEYEGPVTFSDVGEYALEARASNDAGSSDLASVSFAIVEEDDGPTEPPAPPTVVVDPAEPDGPDGAYISAVTVSLSSDDPDATLEWREAGDDWVTYDNPITFSDVGEYALEARASNDAGSSDLASVSFAIVEEDDGPTEPPAPPTVVVDPAEPDGPDGAYISAVTVSVSSDDDEALLEWREGGGDWIEYEGPVTFSDVGEYGIEVRASNDGGSSDTVSMSFTIVDEDGTTPPPPTEVCTRHQGGASFPDSPGSGHREFIDCLAELGVVEGYQDGTFGPTDDVSRGQLASFVVRALAAAGHELPAGDGSFSDVSRGSTHGGAIYRLAGAGVIRGFEDGTFRPSQSVTREQTATFVARGLELVLEGELATSGASFPDVGAGGVHAGAIDKLVTAGVIGGYPDGRFAPREPVTRAQMTRFIGNGLHVLAHEGVYHGG